MKTLDDFFDDVNQLQKHLGNRRGKSVHTQTYIDSCVRLYSEWHNVGPNLQTFLQPEDIEALDENFHALIEESRTSKPSVSKSKQYLENIEEVYILELSYKIDETNIEVTFVNNLFETLEDISNEKYADYLEEAVKCVQINAFRGAIVLGWQAAMFALYKKLEAAEDPIHIAYEKKFGELLKITINSFWDFQKLSDHQILILCESVGVIDKSLKDVLDDEKNIRNKAAHPSQFDVGPNRGKAFLEIIMELLIKLEDEE